MTEPIKSNKGRKKTDPLLKLRTLIWYWAVRYKTGKSDGKLDLEFGPLDDLGQERAYVDRVRIFEDIRNSGCSITRGTHQKREFDLLALVNARHGLQGSADFYNAPFWDYVTEKQPSIESAIDHMIEMVKRMNIYNKPMQQFSMATEDEIKQLVQITGLKEEVIRDNQAYEIHTKNREVYDNLLNSLCGLNDFFQLLEELDFHLLTQYFNHFGFLIAFYRYSMLTGNFHALISASDIINEYSYVLFKKKEWDVANITNALGHAIHEKIYTSSNQGQLTSERFLTQINLNKNDSTLAINTFLQLLKRV